MDQIERMYQQHDGRECAFSEAPAPAQNALRAYYVDQHGSPPIDSEARVRYVVVPTDVLKAAVMASPELEAFRDFSDYHDWYVRSGYMPDHSDASYALLLGGGEDVIYDGWKRFHDYVRKGVPKIPCVVM